METWLKDISLLLLENLVLTVHTHLRMRKTMIQKYIYWGLSSWFLEEAIIFFTDIPTSCLWFSVQRGLYV